MMMPTDSARFPDTGRLVVKVGSSLLVSAAGEVRHDWLAGLAADVAALHRAGRGIAIVSSGAIALGARQLTLERGGRATLEDSQAAAAVGQIALSGAWREALAREGLRAAQMLVTLDDLEDRRRYLNASATLDRLLSLGVVPVINENDSVATAEIRFGDNDRLAARVAQAAGAAGVLLLSDVDGLYDRDPADPAAVLLPHVEAIDARIEAMASGGSGSGMGSGGMRSKLEAARIATRAGIALAIASGRTANPLDRFVAGGPATVFPPVAGSGSARKAWLSGRMAPRGTIHIDAGAAAALVGGASLLPAGTVRVEGTFARGDLVRIVGPDGDVATGLSEYSATEAAAIAGRRRGELAAVLGYAPRAALVHRNHMAAR